MKRRKIEQKGWMMERNRRQKGDGRNSEDDRMWQKINGGQA